MRRGFRRVRMEEIVDQLPAAEAVMAASLPAVDLFICALGFEERTPAGIRELLASNISVKNAIVAVYGGDLLENERMRPQLDGALRSVGQVEWVPFEQDRYSIHLRSKVSRLSVERPHVVVDISSMSGSLMLATLRTVLAVDARLTVLYTEAEAYGPRSQDFENARLLLQEGSTAVDAGVSSIRYSIDFQGVHSPGSSDLVLLVPGFGRDRARAAISYCNPAYLLAPDGHVKWILGVPPRQEHAWRADALAELHSIQQSDIACRVLDSDYKETLSCIDHIFCHDQSGANVTVVPLGTKAQTLGVFLACVARPGIRVLIAEAEVYQAHLYSRGVREARVFTFGETRALGRLLQSVDSLSVVSND